MDLLERHRRYWTGEPLDRPLIGHYREGEFVLAPLIEAGVPEGIITPEEISEPEVFVTLYRHYRHIVETKNLQADLIYALKPPLAIPWMEAIMGCPISVSLEAQAMTARQAFPSSEEVDVSMLSTNEVWLGILSGFIDAFVTKFGNAVPYGQTLMRGPSDVLLALLGSERFLIGLIDNQQSMKEMANRITDLWIDVLRMQIDHMPSYKGGYIAGSYGVWAPGTVASFQEDACGLLSADMYREYFRACDSTIAAAFDYSLMHLHSAQLQMLDDVLLIRELNTINVAIDPLGPKLEDLLPTFRRIQQNGKALHLLGIFSPDEVEYLTDNLSNRLFIAIVDI
jgi:hypothetical protein